MTQFVSNPDDLGCPSSISIDKSPKFPEEWAEVVTIQPAGGNLTCFCDKQGTHSHPSWCLISCPPKRIRLQFSSRFSSILHSPPGAVMEFRDHLWYCSWPMRQHHLILIYQLPLIKWIILVRLWSLQQRITDESQPWVILCIMLGNERSGEWLMIEKAILDWGIHDRASSTLYIHPSLYSTMNPLCIGFLFTKELQAELICLDDEWHK